MRNYCGMAGGMQRCFRNRKGCMGSEPVRCRKDSDERGAKLLPYLFVENREIFRP